MKTKIFKMVSLGGLGDALLTTPVFRAIKAQYPDSKIYVYCISEGHRDIYRNNPFVDKLKLVNFWNMPLDMISHVFKPKRFLKKYFTNNYGAAVPCKGYSIHASAIVAELLGVKLFQQQLEVYLTPAEEEKAIEMMEQYINPVIINITSQTSSNQHWPEAYWDELIRRMPHCTFIQLGIGSERKVEGAIDLRGKTTIRESMAMLKYAKSFLGVVSFMAHATNAVNLPGVVLYGPSSPVIWGHATNVNLFKNLSCAPCIDILLKSKCPYNSACMSEISVGEAVNALERQLYGSAMSILQEA